MVGGTSRRDRSPAGVQGPSVRERSPSSISMERICSTNSGLRPAASATRSRADGSSPVWPRRFSVRFPLSSSVSGWRRAETASSLPPPHPGRSSSSSGRAMHTIRIDARRLRSTTCSIRVEHGGLGPVDVVDDHDHRLGRGHLFQSPPDRPGDLFGRRCGRTEPEDLGDPVCHGLAPPLLVQASPGRRRWIVRADARRAREHLVDRPVADAVPVRQAPTAEDRGIGRQRGDELVDEARFPTPAGPRTVNRWHAPSPTAESKACCRSASGRCRPTMGDSTRLASPEARAQTTTARV
jgi:hypothetical protein